MRTKSLCFIRWSFIVAMLTASNSFLSLAHSITEEGHKMKDRFGSESLSPAVKSIIFNDTTLLENTSAAGRETMVKVAEVSEKSRKQSVDKPYRRSSRNLSKGGHATMMERWTRFSSDRAFHADYFRAHPHPPKNN
ncbi:hypothetical protein KP509_09G076100 [Ceratopteris richardii]|uniref:Uncharacterized protein n=1 Tax=Ceratopteris richardii TaxID=49495 RepID=A0A8T2UBW4_CERRI|nr:hypothetical protein KP509_09G076100 [Ceratopteris richardii]